MWVKIVFFVSCFITIESLDCGVKNKDTNEINRVLSLCIKNNDTFSKILDIIYSDESSSSSSEETIDLHLGRSIRFKRDDIDATTEIPDNTTEEIITENNATEICVMKCIYESFGLLDSNGYINHEKFVKGLIMATESKEMQDFFQDSSNECFVELDQEYDLEPCLYSNKLSLCLSEKGKLNCEDWPVGDLPFTY